MNTTSPAATAVIPVVVTNDEDAAGLLRTMDAEFVELTGRSAYLYPHAVSGTDPWRYVFTDVTAPGPERAVEHMTELLEAARSMDFSTLSWCWS